VYLNDEATPEDRSAIERLLAPGALVAGHEYVSKAEALKRFKQTFAELATQTDSLEGNPMPQLISVPLPEVKYTELKDGVNFWSDLPDNFFTVNEFPPCGVNISGPAIMAQTEENVQ